MQLLPKKFRLSNEEFKAVKKTGTLVSGRLMGILIKETTDYRPSSLKVRLPAEALAKAGIIVSKKISNKAVVRNQLKRRIRAALRVVLPSVPPALRVVVLPNKRAIGGEVKELEEELGSILNKFNKTNNRINE